MLMIENSEYVGASLSILKEINVFISQIASKRGTFDLNHKIAKSLDKDRDNQ